MYCVECVIIIHFGEVRRILTTLVLPLLSYSCQFVIESIQKPKGVILCVHEFLSKHNVMN